MNTPQNFKDCIGEKYVYENNMIALPVMIEGLPSQIEVERYALNLKTSFHISLVSVGKIVEKHNISIPDFEEKVVKDFFEFGKANNVFLKHYRDEFRFVAHNERRTVVVMCEVVNLSGFFDLLNKKYDLDLEYPPTHVTLYTLQPDAGIFLTDSFDIQNFTKVIEAPEDVKKAFGL